MIPEEQLSAYLDDALDGDQRQAVDLELEHDPSALRFVLEQRQLDRVLRSLLGAASRRERLKESILAALAGATAEQLRAQVLADTSGALRWWVRRGTSGTVWVGTGKNRKLITAILWDSSEGWLPTGWQESRANGIAVDLAGNVFVSGSARDTAGLNHWIVRKLAP